MADQTLPDKNDPRVRLAVATSEELRQTWNSNSAEWKGPLPLEAFLRREEHLLAQELAKDGGLTPWILVYEPAKDSPRKILCACESIKKRAFHAVNGVVTEVVCHGVASVFCPVEHRGRGYAAKMIAELSKQIKTWQEEDQKVLFSILYSDIGKTFYATHGWQPFNSSHVNLAAVAGELRPGTRWLSEDDLPDLCKKDIAAIRSQLQTGGQGTTVSVIPDAKTIDWHQARSDFFARELLDKQIPHKGVLVQTADGQQGWCYFQHNWTKVEADKGNKLYILRLTVPEVGEQQQAEMIEALLAAAQAEASAWKLDSVELWSPSAVTLTAAKRLDSAAKELHRDSSSITSLLWFGEGDWHDVKWANNERFGWC